METSLSSSLRVSRRVRGGEIKFATVFYRRMCAGDCLPALLAASRRQPGLVKRSIIWSSRKAVRPPRYHLATQLPFPLKRFLLLLLPFLGLSYMTSSLSFRRESPKVQVGQNQPICKCSSDVFDKYTVAIFICQNRPFRSFGRLAGLGVTSPMY